MALLHRHLGAAPPAASPPKPATTAPPPVLIPPKGPKPSAPPSAFKPPRVAKPKPPPLVLTHPPSPGPSPFDDFVVFDTETTGIGPSARLVEIAGVRIRHGVVVDTFETLVHPEMKIPTAVIRVHGITDAMVAQAPKAHAALSAFTAFVGGRALIAHNAAFDRGILRHEHARVALTPSLASIYCSLKLSRRVFPGLGRYGLAALAAALKIPQPKAHRALADCHTTAEVLRRCLAQHPPHKLAALHGPGRNL